MDDAAVLNVAMADAPEFDQILVIVNDTHYGGAGGQLATTSIAPGASDIPVHELGHSLFDLADEYDAATPGFDRCDAAADCPEPNVSVFSDFARIKWNVGFDPTTPLPTPDTADNATLVGAFEGARYFTTGQFRPVSSCLMRSLGRTFCPVCSEAGVLATYSYAGPIDSISPLSPVSLSTAAPVVFTVRGPKPEPNTLQYTFKLDGSQVAQNATGSYSTTGASLGVGTHTVTVDVQDTSDMVRNDPSQVLAETASWNVTVEATAADSLMSFDNPARPWKTLFPAFVTTVSDANDGPSALQVNGCFYTPVLSPTFTTTELRPVSGRLALDVKARSVLENPRWTGTIRVRATIPGARVINALVGSKTLLLSPLGTYKTIELSVPTWLRRLLQRNYTRASFLIEVESVDCLQPLVIDNLRFL